MVLACPPLTQECEEPAVDSYMLTNEGCIINETLAVAMYNLWVLRQMVEFCSQEVRKPP